MKKILIYTHFFYPEIGAASIRMQYFAKVLNSNDYEVKVIAPEPNYGIGKSYNKSNEKIKFENCDITNLPIFFSGTKSKIIRLISYLSYFFNSFFYGLFKTKNTDVIISSTPPIFTALGAALVSRIKGINFILDIRDIWPDIGIQLGILNSSLSIKGLRIIEKFILKSSNKIIVTTEGDKKNITNKGIDPKKIEIIYNGADTNLFQSVSDDEKESILKEHNLPFDKKIIIYFGSYNLGMNDIDILGDTLSLLDQNKYYFLSVGNGSKRAELEVKIKEKLESTFIDSLNSQDLSKLLAVSDVSIIPRKFIRNDTGGNVPVKCFESWSCGVPVLLSTISETDVEKIFNESQGGILVEPGDPEKLKIGLEKLVNNNFDKNKMREYTINNFDRFSQSSKLSSIISEIK